MFRDRLDAADQLADHLQTYRGQNPLVLAIPRGAVPMGKRIEELPKWKRDFDFKTFYLKWKIERKTQYTHQSEVFVLSFLPFDVGEA